MTGRGDEGAAPRTAPRPGSTTAPPGTAVRPPRPRTAPPAPGDAAPTRLRVSVCRDPEEFAALAPAWERLHRACPQATPFQTHAWLHSWWLSYGRRGRLRVVLVHRDPRPHTGTPAGRPGPAVLPPAGPAPYAGDGAPGSSRERAGGELVGAVALTRTWRPLPALVPVGGAITDHSDVLIDPGPDGLAADRVAAALVRGMRLAARGTLIDLREVRPGGAAERVFALWPGPKRGIADSECLELPGGSMDGLAARVSSSRAQRIRANLRKIDAAGVEERDVPAAEVPDAIEGMLRLHAARWEGRGINPEHLSARFAAHLGRAGAAMTASGHALLTEFRIGGDIVAANLTVMCPTFAGGYLYGADMAALRAAKVDLNTLLTRHGVRLTGDGGRPVLTMLRGAEPHKSHWRPTAVTSQRLVLATRPALPLLLARRVLSAAKAALRPAWRRLRG